MPTRVVVWNEARHEKKNPKVAEIYPNGMHEAIVRFKEFRKELAALKPRMNACPSDCFL